MISSRKVIAVIAAALAAGAVGCTDYDSNTDLNPDGPPMIRQVRMRAVTTDALGNPTTTTVFAFGEHPDATEKDYPAGVPNSPVTGAVLNNKFRVIVDELLVGNNLEEIACRAPVDSDAYSAVPEGATPEDIANCAVAKDALPARCPATMSHAVCICQIDAGCGTVEKGQPVGVLDVNQDGAADDTRMIAGAAGIRCGSIDVPIDLNNSYWNPSGNQNKPAMGGFDALGPAIVIAPDSAAPHNGALPSGQNCQLVFSPNVVDKTGHELCTPPGGAVETIDDQGNHHKTTCTEGDTSGFTFDTQAFTIRNNSFMDGATGVSRTNDVILVASAPIDPSSYTAAITVTGPGNTPVTGYTISQPMPQSLRIKWNGSLSATTTYTLSISSALEDTYDLPVTPVTFTFTTGS
jgi:hypothetical protein